MRSWAPGPLGCSVLVLPLGGGNGRTGFHGNKLRRGRWRLWGPVCPREDVAAPAKPKAGTSGRRGMARGPASPSQRARPWRGASCWTVFGHGWGGLRGTRSSCPHTGERGQEHERGRPWAKSRPARMSAGRASSCPERGQRPVPGCRAAPEHSRGWREPEATSATVVTGLHGGCELQGVPPFFS